MPRRQEGFDDDICLGDGKISVNGETGFHFLVSGSRMVSHSPGGVWSEAQEDTRYRQAWAVPQTFVRPRGMSWCSDCGEWRDNSVFAADPTRANGLDAYCKPHRAARNRMRYAADKAERGEAVRDYRRREA